MLLRCSLLSMLAISASTTAKVFDVYLQTIKTVLIEVLLAILGSRLNLLSIPNSSQRVTTTASQEADSFSSRVAFDETASGRCSFLKLLTAQEDALNLHTKFKLKC
jgi:hypothetical protein